MKFDVPNTDSPSEKVKALPSKSLAKLVWTLVRPYKKWMAIIFAAMMLETLMSLATPWPLKILIDNVIGHHKLPDWLSWMERVFHGENKMQFAAVAAISLIVMAAIGALAGYLNSYFTESIAQYVSNDLRRRIYHHLQRLSLAYYDTHQTGKLLSVITSDVSTIQDFASATMMSITVDFLTIIGMLGIMFYLNAGFTLLAICITPFLLFFVSRFKKVMKKATHEVRVDQSNMLTVMQQGLESIRAVNAFGRQELEENKLKKVSMETVGAALKARRVKSVLNPVITLIVAACTAMVLWQGTDLVLKGAMTVGSLTVFLWYMNKFFSPVQDLAKMTSTIAQATVALERIQSILDTEILIADLPGAEDPGRLTGDIVFDKVSFAYNTEEPVLKGIDLHIESGQRVGICGPTGSGKSTILSLIARFYDTTGGHVYIDGKDITRFSIDGLRSQIAFVLQDTVLFYGSVRDNIAYGRPEATEEEIIEAAKLANAHEFIRHMPHGYDTMVGERGVTLSGGQRQRIGIARAVVRNSPILVLDEPTAALDTEAEKIVMEALEQLMQGRTVITIAHRLSTIADSDKIIVLHDGVIAEEGTHDELIELGQIYAGLYNNQSSSKHPLHKIIL
ncbi:ABC transporter ATP-binding protein [Mucilaginibacter sp.]|jgi:subfamily B ATP-binding cassette protein MsbA|uniref:ABC transporter ATP-binding protein n=1 Tax=Mucilaginibacter sp. TaxID=1882438 RepID=UPI002B591A58|nr:ABC transporter ATP-binding protein [Mucilaginibacter sp.]HTI58769.1 ABC transporter ATP-binding protein [Mucilaginibacter sp.]